MRKRYIKAEEGSENSVVYYDEDGNQLIRHWKRYKGQPVSEASTRSWRNNNPGNLVYNKLNRERGAIGNAGKDGDGYVLAVFPDYATGRKAQWLLLKGSKYINLTLHDLPRKYLGLKIDTQKVKDYRNSIHSFTKFDMERTIASLSEWEFAKLLDAMQNHEGWREGREEYIKVMDDKR